MRVVSDTSWLQSQTQQATRSGVRNARSDFSSFLQATQSGKAADMSGADDTNTSVSAATTGDGGNSVDTAQVDGSGNQGGASVQWLASQLFAYKVKEPVQSVNGDGSVSNSIATSVVTMPRTSAGPDAPGIAGTGVVDLASLLNGTQAGSTDTSVIDTSTVDTSAIDTSTVDTSAIDTSGVDTTGTTSSVDPTDSVQVENTDTLLTNVLDPQHVEPTDVTA